MNPEQKNNNVEIAPAEELEDLILYIQQYTANLYSFSLDSSKSRDEIERTVKSVDKALQQAKKYNDPNLQIEVERYNNALSELFNPNHDNAKSVSEEEKNRFTNMQGAHTAAKQFILMARNKAPELLETHAIVPGKKADVKALENGMWALHERATILNFPTHEAYPKFKAAYNEFGAAMQKLLAHLHLLKKHNNNLEPLSTEITAKTKQLIRSKNTSNILQYLRECSVLPNAKKLYSYALRLAAANNMHQLIVHLTLRENQINADPLGKDDKKGQIALHHAIRLGHAKVIEVLLRATNPHNQFVPIEQLLFGDTPNRPIDLIADIKKVKTRKLVVQTIHAALLEANENSNTQSGFHFGHTISREARTLNLKLITDCLAEHVTFFNTQTKLKKAISADSTDELVALLQTPETKGLRNWALRYAAATGQAESCKSLLAAGADRCATGNDTNMLPIHYAMKNSHAEVAMVLLEEDLIEQLNAVDSDKHTPLQLLNCELISFNSIDSSRILVFIQGQMGLDLGQATPDGGVFVPGTNEQIKQTIESALSQHAGNSRASTSNRKHRR